MTTEAPDTLTLAQGRFQAGLAKVKAGTQGDVTCECCGYFIGAHRRNISRGMAKFLAYLCDNAPSGMKAGDVFREMQVNYAGDYAKLRYWGLIEEGQKSTWRPTEKGFQFRRSEIEIARYCYVVEGKPEGFSEEQISFGKCLDQNFDEASLKSHQPWAEGEPTVRAAA